jgi:cell division protein FtsL
MTTILRSHKSSISLFLIAAVFVIIFLVLGNIWFYNKIVGFQYLLSSRKKLLEQTEQEIISLQEKIYQLTDEQNLKSLAEKRGLVLLKRPEFLKPND